MGVLISVTTIPAAANAAAALAYWVSEEAVGSLIQLGLNVSAIVVGGLLTLGAQKAHQDPPGQAGDQPGRTVIAHRSPGARLIRASAVTSGHSIASARATYAAS